MKLKYYLMTMAVVCASIFLNAQDTIRNEKGGGYLFTKVINLEATSVKDQSSTGTCWSFLGTFFFLNLS